jgi:chorismate dehydratase
VNPPMRIGKIQFTNILPIYYLFDQRGINVEWIVKTPAELNQCMVKNEIDMSPISSFAYAKNNSHYVLLPNLSISCMGPVGSIFLFSKKKKLPYLHESSIALTNTSASSVVLLRILLEKFVGVVPRYITMEPHLEKMMEQADAALLIGDDALKAHWRNSAFYVFDLGQQWYQWTGFSLTLAVWAVQKEIVENKREALKEIFLRFIQAKKRGVNQRALIISQAMRQLGGNPIFWEDYFTGLCYDLRDKELVGLKAYYRFAAELGLLSSDVPIRILDFTY